MQTNRRYHKSRNKNRNHQVNFESFEGEGEFLNESNDSMLTLSDSLGNMDPLDSERTTEIDRTLLDEFAGDSDLSAEHAFVEGNESEPHRVGATAKPAQTRKKPHKTSKDAVPSRTRPLIESNTLAAKGKSKAIVTGLNIKDRVEPLLSKVQDFMQPYREDLSLRFQEAYVVAKAKGKVLDKRIKTQPYVYALGAIVAGFALARLFTAGQSTRK